MNRLSSLLRGRLQAEADSRKTRRKFQAEDLCRRGKRTATEQLAFIADPARRKVACCSRRAGKTTACAILLLDYALRFPESLCLYVTLTRVSGKRIVWRRLLKLNQEYELGGVPSRVELSLTFPNGSFILLAGAKDEAEVDKLRGIDPAPRLVVIDEGQAFRAHVQDLVDDVLEPMLLETKGTLVLIGTPGKVRTGYFYEACRSAAPGLLRELNVAAAEQGDKAWSVHHWTINSNPFIDDVDDELSKLRKKRGWTPAQPTYQREYLGRWVTEHDALVYRYDHVRNGYRDFPDTSAPEWRCVMVIDQGFVDADAIGELWFRPRCPGVWLKETHHDRRASAGQLVGKAAELWAGIRGRCIKVLWDEGGGGAKVAEDARLQGVPAEPAEKRDKIAGVELVNSALLTGCLQIPQGGHAAHDAGLVTWDPRARGVRFSERYHTDMWDVVVYGMRSLLGIVPLDRPAELAALPEPDAEADLERRQRISGRMRESGRSWVDKLRR